MERGVKMYLYLDTETTGMKTPEARVVEVAAVVLNERDVEIAHFSMVANPGAQSMALADPMAMNTHGIPPDEIAVAPPIEQVARNLERFLDEYWGATFHAFNREFDAWHLERDPWKIHFAKWGECIMLASMEVMNAADAIDRKKSGEPRWPSLFRAAKFFGVIQDGAHRALEDARTAARIHAKIRSHREAAAAASEASNILEQGY
jgi:DNA polymerase III epsilon subunit-like protein